MFFYHFRILHHPVDNLHKGSFKLLVINYAAFAADPVINNVPFAFPVAPFVFVMVFGVPFKNTPAFPAYQFAAEGISAGDAVGIVFLPSWVFFSSLSLLAALNTSSGIMAG